ncbi:hypothetical protein [Amycolatopsis lurida]|uniref:hypothetical protein n=1 Tax=Amycolatopsis lurida TaxID=31959 RepID=UPI00365E855A
MPIEPELLDPVTVAGWTLTVAADGREAQLHAPAGVVITELSGSRTTLALSNATVRSRALDAGSPPRWDVGLAERILRRARPAGSLFLRALVDQGGTATAEKLREVTGLEFLNHATRTLTESAAVVFSDGDPEQRGRYWRHFFATRRHPDQPRGRVYDYYLSDELVPIFAEALTRLGR